MKPPPNYISGQRNTEKNAKNRNKNRNTQTPQHDGQTYSKPLGHSFNVGNLLVWALRGEEPMLRRRRDGGEGEARSGTRLTPVPTAGMRICQDRRRHETVRRVPRHGERDCIFFFLLHLVWPFEPLDARLDGAAVAGCHAHAAFRTATVAPRHRDAALLLEIVRNRPHRRLRRPRRPRRGGRLRWPGLARAICCAIARLWRGQRGRVEDGAVPGGLLRPWVVARLERGLDERCQHVGRLAAEAFPRRRDGAIGPPERWDGGRWLRRGRGPRCHQRRRLHSWCCCRLR